MHKNWKDGHGVMSILNGLHNACSPSNAEFPALACVEGASVVGIADAKIRRYYLVKEARKHNLETVTGEGPFEELVARQFYDIANRIFELEVWLRYPQLAGQTIVVYDDWSIGPEKSDSKTGDMFSAAELKTLRSTRSADVNIGAVRGATITN